MVSRSVYGGIRRRRRIRGRGDVGKKIGSWAGDKLEDWLAPKVRRLVGMRRRRRMRGGLKINPMTGIIPYQGQLGNRRRRIRGRGWGSSIGSWLGDKAEGAVRNVLGLGRRRRRRPALGRRAVTYVGAARRSRSRYA